MNKKFYIDKFLLHGWILIFSTSIILFVVFLILKILNKDANLYLQLGLLSLFFNLLIIKRSFQWVEIDRKGIYAKSLFGLIKFCSWENINNIELAMTLEGSKHTGQYYIIFCNDNVKEKYRLTYNRKYLNIRVPYRKETKKCIEKYFNKNIVDLSYETILKRRKN